MEEKWFQVAAGDIEADFNRLEEVVQGVPAPFMNNLNEMGHQEWEERQEEVW
jgi:hypothetical protein